MTEQEPTKNSWWKIVGGIVAAITAVFALLKLIIDIVGEESALYVVVIFVLFLLPLFLGVAGFGKKTIKVRGVLQSTDGSVSTVEKKAPLFETHYKYFQAGFFIFIAFSVIGGAIFLSNRQNQQYFLLQSEQAQTLTAQTQVAATATQKSFIGQQEWEEREKKLVVVVAAFDGQEERYGVRNKLVETLHRTFSNDENIEIIPVEEKVTAVQGSEYARQLGEQYQADLVIWAWYMPTENPNITLYFENLSPEVISVIEDSEMYQPQATLSDLEAFKIQYQISQEASTLIAFIQGVFAYSSKDYESAIKYFEVVGNADNSNYVSLEYLLMYVGICYSGLGETDTAIQFYNFAILENPTYATPYNNRGWEYYKQGNYEQAIADYELAIWYDSMYVTPYINRGWAYYNQGNYALAMADYNKALELDPNYPKHSFTYNDRGLVYFEWKDYERAIADYEKAMELDPAYALPYNNRGLVYYKQGKYDLAVADYERAMELDPKYASPYNNRGWVYYKQGDYARAIADYERAMEIDPTYVDPYNNRGWLYHRQGDYIRAIADFEKSMELAPKYASPYNGRGDVYKAQGKYDLAKADYQQAVALLPQPNSASEYNSRCWAYYNMGEYQQALPDCEKAIALDPDNDHILDSRAFVYAALGMKEEAIKDFERILEISTDPALRKRAEDELKKLKEQ